MFPKRRVRSSAAQSRRRLRGSEGWIYRRHERTHTHREEVKITFETQHNGAGKHYVNGRDVPMKKRPSCKTASSLSTRGFLQE